MSSLTAQDFGKSLDLMLDNSHNRWSSSLERFRNSFIKQFVFCAAGAVSVFPFKLFVLSGYAGFLQSWTIEDHVGVDARDDCFMSDTNSNEGGRQMHFAQVRFVPNGWPAARDLTLFSRSESRNSSEHLHNRMIPTNHWVSLLLLRLRFACPQNPTPRSFNMEEPLGGMFEDLEFEATFDFREHVLRG